MKGWICTSLALLWELMEPISTHKQRWEGPYADFNSRVPWRRNVICPFVCQDHRGSAVTCRSFHSCIFPSFSFSLLLLAFPECNLVWWAGGLFWVSQYFWLPPLACGAFRWSQSCRPGLEEWRGMRRWRSTKSTGIGDLNAPQSEPCRVQIERVILLLKLSATPHGFCASHGHAWGPGLSNRVLQVSLGRGHSR